jgi:hypothetical protein
VLGDDPARVEAEGGQVRDSELGLSYLWIYPGLFRSMVGNLLSYAAPWCRLTFSHEDQKDIQKWNDELYAGQPQ